MAKKKKKKKRKTEEAEMNMTPMIDVTFLLLIFFLCLEFKTLEGKLATNLPKDVGVNKSKAMPIEKLDLRIVMKKWGTEKKDRPQDPRFELLGHEAYYYLGPQRISKKSVLNREMRKAAKKRVVDDKGKSKPPPITIKTGPGVVYKDVTEVVDLALDAGFEEITFGGGEGTRQNPGAK